MNEAKIKKLTLSRETVRVLSGDELAGVDGGTSASVVRTAIQASKNYCVKATKWVTVNVCVPVSLEYCTTVLPNRNGGQQQGGQQGGQGH